MFHKYVKNAIKNILKSFNIGVVNYSNIHEVGKNNETKHDLDFLLKLPDESLISARNLLKKSKAQLRQDLFVLSEIGYKNDGYFVEFGATNGVELSNTYLLEKEFHWKGILAEPARCWSQNLKNNRTCNIETKCVWSSSNSVLTFNEVSSAELSTINIFSSSDNHKDERKHGKTYEVETISLTDLLDKYKAPQKIDYLSIDTEGSEFEILKSFDFDKYEFKVITCEHNFTLMREKIYQLLTSKGYTRKFEDISKFDDWYVKS